MIKPPFNYTGNKNRLVNEFSNSLFPEKKDINFLDLFGGGATISINVNYNNITYNDISFWVPNVIDIMKRKSIKDILLFIKKTINKFQLSSTHFYGQKKYRKLREGNNGLKKINQVGYYNLRSHINKRILNKNFENKTYLLILVLMFYSFNNDIRFNRQNFINIPIGKTDFNTQSYNKLITFTEAIKRKKIKIMSKDFRKIDINKYDFIYADPPYFISEAIYNNKWTKKEEKDLYNILLSHHLNGKKFALSNVMKSKGKINKMLKEFVNNNNFKIIKLNYSYKSASYNRNRVHLDEEVVITNV